MKRGVAYFVLVLLFLQLTFVVGDSIDSEVKKLTHYAEDYETGNIDYVQLILYASSVSQNLNELLGATRSEHGDLLKQDKIESVLGLLSIIQNGSGWKAKIAKRN